MLEVVTRPRQQLRPHARLTVPATQRALVVSTTGVVLGAAGYLVSLTPSLVPRTTGGQVAVSVLLSVTGYAVGALIGWIARHTLGRVVRDRAPLRHLDLGLDTPMSRGGWLLLVMVGALTFTPWGMRWQGSQAETIGWTYPSWVAVVVLTPVLVVALVRVGRAIRAGGRNASRAWGRLLPRPLAAAAGFLSMVVLVVLLLGGAFGLVVRHFVLLDAQTASQEQPTSSLVSGSPGSLVEWGTMGWQGRAFVAEASTGAEIAGFTGRPAMDPIRVYVGEDTAPDARERARLAVAELHRTNAFDRDALVIVVTSGLGSVHPVSARSLEYVSEGDVATVATQFAKVPSWMTTILDPRGAQREAEALVGAVMAAVEQLPAAQRPDVYLHGESLGAFGSQQMLAGSTPAQVVDRFSGVLWVGTPAASNLAKQWAEYPDGTPAWEPVVGDGSIARFAAEPTRIPLTDPGWGPRRVLFLHSATDPVVHLAGAVATSRPAWLADDRGDRVPEGMVWWPLFTWEQLVLDLTTNGIVPPGLGHNYSNAHAAGWAAVMHPVGWDAAEIDRFNEYERIEPGT